MRRLPPLNALRVFEVAARTGSYAEAAAQLGVTHGAVSRQIAALEGWLGQRLFTREGRRMVATPMAIAFATEVGQAFDRLAVAAAACGRPATRRILRVSAPTSFAIRWLIPRLDRFQADHPNVEIAVTTVTTVIEQVRGDVDVAIRRGVAGPAWPGRRVVPVLDDIDTLIMSPGLFARRPILQPADIDAHVWLASETRAGDWPDWLEAAGLRNLAGHSRQIYDHFFVTRQAVEDGLGIGIGPLPLLAADMDSGRLMTPLPHIRVPRQGYVAIIPEHFDAAGVAAGFVDWLAGEGLRPPAPAPAAAHASPSAARRRRP